MIFLSGLLLSVLMIHTDIFHTRIPVVGASRRQFATISWQQPKQQFDDEIIRRPSRIVDNDLIASDTDTDDTIYDDIEAVKILVSETLYDISASLSRLAGEASITITIFLEATRSFLESAKKNVDNIIGIIAAKILEVTDEGVRCLFENIKIQLEKIQTVFEELSKIADEEFEGIMNHVNESLISVSEDMEEWSYDLKAKLRSVKDDRTYKEGCEYIDNFISSSIAEMYECCNIAIKPVKTICQRVKIIIEHTLELAIDVVDRIEKCVLDRRIPARVMINCLNDGYDKVNDLLAEGMSLKHNIMETLPIKIVISNFCISFATVSVEVRKNDVAREVDKKYLRKQ